MPANMQNDQQLREDLAAAARHMTELRQEHSENAERIRVEYDRFAAEWDRGVVAGLDLALHALHVWTDGEFGADFLAGTAAPPALES